MLAREAVQEAVELVKPKAKKIGKKLKLQEEPEEGKQEQIPEKPTKTAKTTKITKTTKTAKKTIPALEIQEVLAEDLVPVETEVMELIPKPKKTKGKKKIVEFEVIEEDK
jgi:hypothetical protein